MWTWLVVGLFCIYAAAFIWQTSCVIDGVRYFSLFDDAMISMRYARNLANGNGLVWNPGGERVEGYTNLGWVLFMSVAHRLPVAERNVSLIVQLAALGLLVANLFVVRRIAWAYSDGDLLATRAVVAITAFYYPLVNWSLQGTEFALLTMLLSLSIAKAFAADTRRRFSPAPYLLLACATVVRIDFTVAFVTFWVFAVVRDPKYRAKHVWVGAVVLIVVLAVQTTFRVLYYGDVLPNTYYLKVTGVPLLLRITRGAVYAAKFAFEMNWMSFLVPVAAVAFQRDRKTQLLAVMFLGQLAYSVFVGGDAWEFWGGSNRFTTPVMPLFFVLFCTTVTRAAAWLAQALARRPAAVLVSRGAVGIFLFGSFLSFNELNGPKGLLQLTLVQPPSQVTDNASMVRQALAVKSISTEDATVAVVWAGAIPYFSGRNAIDLLGKNDRVIAHEPAQLPHGFNAVREVHPGHNKWDLHYSIGRLQPDLIAQLWWELPEPEKSQYERVRFQGFKMFARRDSTKIRWDQLERVSPERVAG